MIIPPRAADCKEDSTYIIKLQKHFVNLYDELMKHNENAVSESTLTGQILSTLGKDVNFRDVWHTITISEKW